MKIPDDDIYHTFEMLIAHLDLSRLYELHAIFGRKNHYPLLLLFKIVTFARVINKYSSREIHDACRTDIRFIHMLQGFGTPSHNTINRFIQKIEPVFEELFAELVSLLISFDEINYKNLFIDGTKLEANANKYSFVWKKSLEKNLPKLELKIIELIQTISSMYPDFQARDSFDFATLEKLQEFLMHQVIHENITFVYGSGKRKHPLQKVIETLSEYKTKWIMYQDYMTCFGDRNSFSKTDRDATFMHMKEDHMRNSQLKPGYNVQIAVSGEYIVGVDLSQERSDHYTLIPFLELLKEIYPKTWENIIADAGYESEENYVYLKSNGYEAYIKPTNHEQMKTRSYKKNIGRRENMNYDEASDTFTCHNGKLLTYIYTSYKTMKSGYTRESRHYEASDCKDCPIRNQCTKAKSENNKKIQFSKQFNDLREISTQNINSDEGIVLRMNRSIQVEGAFGVIKQDYGFRRFLRKGIKNVKLEFLLIAFAYNVRKYHNKVKNNLTGVTFYNKEVA